MMFDPTDPKHELALIGARPDRIPERNFTKYPLTDDWQMMGEYRVVSSKIPSPIAYLPRRDARGQAMGPYAWIGHRGVLSAAGSAWDYETGSQMTTGWREPPGRGAPEPKPGALLIDKVYKGRS